MHDLSTTLVAIASAPGRGGIGCLRLSGSRAVGISEGLFRGAASRRPRPGGPPCFGRFLGRDGKPLDHGFLVVFRPTASYTGESTVELWTHGSPPVLAELVETAVAAGAVHAGPGEFTYRAVRNGRLDLARAEAVRDLVDSRTLYQARVALAQAEGSISRALSPLRELLEEWIARSEAAVEFVEESETHMGSGDLDRAIDQAVKLCSTLLEQYGTTGRIVRDGARLVIVGRPNAGKSSLFNRLLAEDRAIVADIPGTTRDTLEEELDLGGVPVRLVDTAGLREVTDQVESEGVRRAEQARADADLVAIVVDGSTPLADADREMLERLASDPADRRTVIVVNKSDLPSRIGDLPGHDVIQVSALNGSGCDVLRNALREQLLGPGIMEDPIITNGRHARALERTRAALDSTRRAMDEGLPDDLVLEDLKLAMRELGTITGEFTNEDLYDGIFSRFCLGK
jgi:tRNA modification GTPase